MGRWLGSNWLCLFRRLGRRSRTDQGARRLRRLAASEGNDAAILVAFVACRLQTNRNSLNADFAAAGFPRVARMWTRMDCMVGTAWAFAAGGMSA